MKIILFKSGFDDIKEISLENPFQDVLDFFDTYFQTQHQPPQRVEYIETFHDISKACPWGDRMPLPPKYDFTFGKMYDEKNKELEYFFCSKIIINSNKHITFAPWNVNDFYNLVKKYK